MIDEEQALAVVRAVGGLEMRFTTNGYTDREMLAEEIHSQGFGFSRSAEETEGLVAVVLNELFKGLADHRGDLNEKAQELLHVVSGIVACAREEGLVDAE